MSKSDVILNSLINRIQKEDSSFGIWIKEDSLLMKICAVLLFFNRNFMEGFITTLGSKVYFPRKVLTSPSRVWPILAHEWIHIKQSHKDGIILHSLKYIFPQILSVFALLSFFALWFSKAWLWNLLFLVFILPFPAYWRAEKEFEAYMMNIFIAYKQGYLTDKYIQSRAKHFYRSSYYFMWPFKKSIIARFYEETEKVKAGDYDNKPAFKEVREILTRGI